MPLFAFVFGGHMCTGDWVQGLTYITDYIPSSLLSPVGRNVTFSAPLWPRYIKWHAIPPPLGFPVFSPDIPLYVSVSTHQRGSSMTHQNGICPQRYFGSVCLWSLASEIRLYKVAALCWYGCFFFSVVQCQTSPGLITVFMCLAWGPFRVAPPCTCSITSSLPAGHWCCFLPSRSGMVLPRLLLYLEAFSF